jgi:hypothetical protein
MTIECLEYDQFIAIIISLTKQGMGFKADAHRLLITLTGAH